MPRVLTIVSALGMLAAAGACGLSAHDIAFVERDDVVLAVPTARAGAVDGEAHALVTDTAAAIDGWLGSIVDDTASVVTLLEEHRETRREGAFGVYGPFDDPERNVAWLVKLDERDDGATFELWIGPPGAGESEVALAVHGDVEVDDDRRAGTLTLDFDVLDRQPALRPDAERLAGAVTVVFEHSLAVDSARVELRFVDFVRDAEATWTPDDTIVHERDAAGGSLRAGFRSEGAMTGLIGELQVTHIELDARWDRDAAGRIRARAPQSANPDSGLSQGDLLLHECFDPAGGLTFRELNGPYAVDRPTYGFGSATSCVFADADLGPT
jgi:hypothetical protein